MFWSLTTRQLPKTISQEKEQFSRSWILTCCRKEEEEEGEDSSQVKSRQFKSSTSLFHSKENVGAAHELQSKETISTCTKDSQFF